MKNTLICAAAGAILAAVTGCKLHVFSGTGGWSDAELTAVTNIIQTTAIPASLRHLEVDNRFGAVHVTGTDGGSNLWTWKLTVRAHSDSVAEQIANSASCKVELENDRLSLVVSLPDTREPHSIQSDLVITVPKSAAVRAQDRFGSVEIADLTGDVEAENQNGRVEIRNIGGSVHARTSFSGLNIRDTGPANLRNQNGEIEAENVNGVLEAVTSFAPLVVRDIHGQARLENQNGRIEALGIGGPLTAKTSFDSLVARDIAGSVQLRDQNGRITVVRAGGDANVETSFSGLSVEEVQGNAVLANQNGGVEASGVTGSVKATTSFAPMDVTGAGPGFVCRNQNGSIRLRATSTTFTNIEANTSFAALTVRLPGGVKPAITARTSFADVESDFPILMKRAGEDPFVGLATDAARVSLRNQNGKISVVRE